MGLLDGLLKEVLGGAMTPGAADDRGRPGAGSAMPGMGGLESILGGLAGGGGGAPAGGMGAGAAGGAALIAVLMQLLQRNGGLGGLLQQFQQAGYGRQADSWVATGDNLPIDGDALSKVLGSGQLEAIAQQLGMSRGQAADRMASALPDVVNQMTPKGSVPGDADDVVSRALEILQRKGR